MDSTQNVNRNMKIALTLINFLKFKKEELNGIMLFLDYLRANITCDNGQFNDGFSWEYVV